MSRAGLQRAVERLWYGGGAAALLLQPLAWLFGAGAAARDQVGPGELRQPLRLAQERLEVGQRVHRCGSSRSIARTMSSCSRFRSRLRPSFFGS